ncbi:PPE domain-containing protein [Nocardia sp. NPDC050378]|uniref:PPE domain-containing protein n=1 Tax=Nocardia sp. NPDC050378 TaxID=3155400 RepID=UPI0033DFB01D
MIEPPQPGFTGVVWEAREPAKLATDLTSGAGPMPMADAAAAWTRLAAAFGAAALDYEQVLHTLRGSWKSGSSEQVWERISALREWLLETAAAATANAARLQAQVLAYEVAALAMPNTADIAAIAAMQQALEQVGTALGAPIKAIAAQTDTEADAAKAVASRVMRSYEAATEPLSTPWLHAPPPPIAPETALTGERSGNPAATPAASGSLGIVGAGMGMGALPPMPAPIQTAYRAPVFAQSATAVTTTPQPTPVATPTGQAAPVAPAAMAPAAGGQDTAHRFPRAGLAHEEADQLVAEGEIQAAPAVLGVAERAAAPTTNSTAEGRS